MAALRLKSVAKTFGRFDAVHPTDIEIPSGEFFAILGPSGCGKTTLLRMIAGYERPDAGSVFLGDADITSLRPQERGIGMVFQNYALFPHMNVFDNIAFGLRARKITGDELRKRVAEALESVALSGKSGSPVTALSGGEQQRVAVARALVVRPRLLLFDEPLSNLDIALRVQTREEIRRLQQSTGITTVYVTHDQGEAMSLADTIAVMRAGKVEQSGPPATVYSAPASTFVAQFLGSATLIDCEIERGGGRISWGDVSLQVPGGTRVPPPGPAVLAVKPEGVSFAGRGEPGSVPAIVVSREYTGFTTTFGLKAGGSELKALLVSTPRSADVRPGMEVSLLFEWRHCHLYGVRG